MYYSDLSVVELLHEFRQGVGHEAHNEDEVQHADGC